MKKLLSSMALILLLSHPTVTKSADALTINENLKKQAAALLTGTALTGVVVGVAGTILAYTIYKYYSEQAQLSCNKK